MPSRNLTSAANGMAGLDWAGPLHDCSGCAWIAFDERRRIVSFSREAERLVRLSARQVLNRPVEVLPGPLQKIIKATFSTGKAVRDRRIELPAAGASQIAVRLTTIAIRTSKGKHIAVIALMSDLRLVGKLGDTLQRLQRLASLGILSAGLAHEIKNALVAVRTFIDLLLERNQDAELAEIVGREMRRVNSLVSQMLRCASPARLVLSATGVHELLDASLRMIQHQLESKLVTLRRTYTAAPDFIKGDDHQLQQAFMNLFLNAADALGPNGELSVTTAVVSGDAASSTRGRATKPPQMRITIKDTGVGIAPENMNRLFEPFFTTKRNGTGLGLSIAHRIIQAHGGTITAESQINQGTTFHILLPLLVKAH